MEQDWEEAVCSRARLLCPRPVLPAAESGPCALRLAPAWPAPATPRGDPRRRVAAVCGDSVLSLLQGSELSQSCQAVEGLVSCFPAHRPTQTLNTPQKCEGGLPSTRPRGALGTGRWSPSSPLCDPRLPPAGLRPREGHQPASGSQVGAGGEDRPCVSG